jgi:hypothetical protein
VPNLFSQQKLDELRGQFSGPSWFSARNPLPTEPAIRARPLLGERAQELTGEHWEPEDLVDETANYGPRSPRKEV